MGNNLADKLKASQDEYAPYDPTNILGIAQENNPYYGAEANQMAPEPPSLRREHEERVSYHRLQAENADQAAAFFRENPAFDRFVQLVRSGVIKL